MVRATISTNHDTRSVSAAGELDISNLSDLKTSIERMLKQGHTAERMIIDLCKVSYIDSAVLEVIVRTRNVLAKSGNRLEVIARRDSQPDRVLRTCRFDSILDLTSMDLSVVPTSL